MGVASKTCRSFTRHPLAHAVALAIALGSASAQAATITVTSNADAALPADDGNCTLREAIAAANANAAVDTCTPGDAGLDTITFADGLGTITLTTGQLEITETVSITGPAAGQTISGNNASRIFAVTVADQALTLENLTLTAGYTSADGSFPGTCAADRGEGGAVCTLGKLTLTNSTVSNSFTVGNDAHGGGLFVRGNATLSNSTVSGNRTSGIYAHGGGLFVRGNATLTNSTVSGNATGGVRSNGGGLRVRGNATLTNSTVSDNSTDGAAAYAGGLRVDRNATLTNSTVSGNRTTGDRAEGGGLWVGDNATLTNSTVSGNRTSGLDADGGGLWLGGNATLTNSTVTDNTARTGGGGIHLYYDSGYTLTLDSTILAANFGFQDNLRAGSNTINARFSLFGDDPSEINGTNTSNVFDDNPGVAPLADNGCAVPAPINCVPTHALLGSSPALDTGDNPLSLTTDQRGSGFPRTLHTATDIGAFERAANFIVTTIADSSLGSLREAVLDANRIPGADTITFSNGLGTITLTSGQLDITETVSITGPAAGQTISGNNASRIFAVTVADQALTLENLTLTGSDTSADGAFPAATSCAADTGEGGAVCALGDLTLSNSTVSDNRTRGYAAYGGGLYVGGTATLTNSEVRQNRAGGLFSYGGGLYVRGDAMLSNSTVSGNRTTKDDAPGGGLFVRGNATLADSTVSDNSTNCSSFHCRGGGLYVDGNATLSNSTVSGNSTTGDFSGGGGLYVDGNATLSNSTVSGNSTDGSDSEGGGLFVRGNATLSNSTVTANQADSGGGGIHLYGSGSTLDLDSTILAGNTGPEGNLQPRSNTINARFSLFGDDPSEINGSNTSNVFDDNPGVAPLADNGCAVPAPDNCVQTHAVLGSSLALDAGDNPLGLLTDQRGSGFPRTIGIATDIGAFERPSFTVTTNANSGTDSLRDKVGQANALFGNDVITFADGLGPIVLTTGQLDISEALTIRGPAAGQIISGDNNSRIFNVNTTGAPLTLENLTLRDGFTDNNGGAVRVRFSDLTLTNSTVLDNTALGTANNANGGGLWVRDGDLTLTNSAVLNNTATAILNNANGGGLFAQNSILTLTNSTIAGNDVAGDNANGGGLLVRDGDLALSNSTVSGNSADGTGLNNNGRGGGLFVDNSDATLTHSTVTANQAERGGGGIHLTNNNPGRSLTLDNTILAANTGPQGNLRRGNNTVDGSFNLFGDAASEINDTDPSSNNNILTNAPELAALADNGCITPHSTPSGLACVQTHAPLPDSPALDAAGATTCTSAPVNGLDQRGFSRGFDATGIPDDPQPGDCDIGAHEADGVLSFSLTQNQWQLISPLPLDNFGDTTVGEVVGDDILVGNLDNTVYGSEWIVYRRDDAADQYVALDLNSALEVGRGYWLKTLSSDQQFGLSGDANSATAIALEAAPNPADGRANKLGHPFTHSVCWSDVEISDDGFSTTLSLDDVDPGGICDTDPSDPSCIMSRIMYQWNGAAYQSFDGVTPGAEGVLDIFDGFFVKAYQAGYELRVPATPGCSSTLTLKAASPASKTDATQANEWSLRLIVSSGRLTDPGNLLGRLDASADGFDAHDLNELPADFEPYLTLVFPHPEWGEQAGDYTTDYRAPSSDRRAVTDWAFEIRSDQPREITLSWEIPTQDLRHKSRLIDIENRVQIRPKNVAEYTVPMVGTRHRFTWRLRQGR